ncbi:probable cytochrome P450 6a14 [Monomorium pharaonis]|uniref:probable cytochrome P450 6a14 n=1 Tax=Monomorium pharaonis TaxID=307658 RepID=UPI001746547B|nr:probable cytochrome P450 6a14 [Monomorium pharaonis]XP_012536198.2 probable cytochrome P450 6a14 [Monomorium pharaonis]XP_012536199.2 probable cytochrome P450 6a14 [Monomorium pharaonis]XP_036143273.1 probable cytochrome P450 6a14 [Monomorium pharaonis]
MMIEEFILGLIIVLGIVYIYYKFVIFNFWHKRGVFYVDPVVPTGNISALITGKTQTGVFFHDAYMKYKDHRVFGMYSLYKPNLVIADLDLIRTVLTKDFGSFHDRGMFYNDKTDPLSSHLFFMPGKKWRNLRIKMTPTFTSGKIKQMFPILEECGEELAKYLESKALVKDTIEMKDIFTRYTTDVIMSTAFGIKSKCIEEPNNEYRIQGKKIFAVKPLWIALFMFVPQIMDFFSIPLTDPSVTKFYMNMFRESVEYRKVHNIVRHDFMHLLIQLMDKGYVEPDGDKKTNVSSEAAVHKLTMTEATAQSYIFFIAGFETSSTTATLALYELAQQHDIQDKVYKEINEILAKHGSLTYDAVNEMTYLNKIINETLRKYPPLPVLNRICTQETDLPTVNIRVPKGTFITIPLLGLHRDPSIYPNPDRFDPERFNADKIRERHPYAYMPFGEGPRNCIGARFGSIQTKIGLICLLSKYKFKLHPRTPIPLIFDESYLVLQPKGGVHFIIESR